MLTQLDSFPHPIQESEMLQGSAMDFLETDQKLRALETELDRLRRVVCYLLEKNERLRSQNQAWETAR